MIEKTIKKSIQEALQDLDLETADVHLEHPTDFKHGDISSNIAMVVAKKTGKNPKELAKEIVQYIEQTKPNEIERVEVAGSGFINFYLSKTFFTESIDEIIKKGDDFGKNENFRRGKRMQ